MKPNGQSLACIYACMTGVDAIQANVLTWDKVPAGGGEYRETTGVARAEARGLRLSFKEWTGEYDEEASACECIDTADRIGYG